MLKKIIDISSTQFTNTA